MDKFNYVVKKSSELTNNEISDFLEIINTVFNHDYDHEWFNWKYLSNIYGESIVVITYFKSKAIGSRAFWRNDLNERIAYQPVDTAVIKEFRGHGIFYEMTKQALGLVEDAIVYNYPNNNSLQGYLNLGWRIINVFNLKLFDSLSVDEFDDSIDSNYISWRFKNNPVKEYYYIKRYNKYFLLSKKKYNIYYVLAEIDRNEASHFKKAKIPILLYYSTKKNKIKMLNNKSRIVLYGENDIEIYNMFKGDAI